MSTKPSFEETPDLQGAFPRLSDAQIAALDAQGRRRSTQPGDVLFAEGDRECDFFVVLAGKAASVEGHGTPEERVIAVHGRGRFLGELSLLTGEGSFYTALALDAGEVLAVPVARLRELIARGPKVVLVKHLIDKNSRADTFNMLAVTETEAWFAQRPLYPFARQPVGVGDLTSAIFLARTLLGDSVRDALEHTLAAVNAVVRTTFQAGRYELEIVASQDEIAYPTERFPALGVDSE